MLRQISLRTQGSMLDLCTRSGGTTACTVPLAKGGTFAIMLCDGLGKGLLGSCVLSANSASAPWVCAAQRTILRVDGAQLAEGSTHPAISCPPPQHAGA